MNGMDVGRKKIPQKLTYMYSVRRTIVKTADGNTHKKKMKEAEKFLVDAKKKLKEKPKQLDKFLKLIKGIEGEGKERGEGVEHTAVIQKGTKILHDELELLEGFKLFVMTTTIRPEATPNFEINEINEEREMNPVQKYFRDLKRKEEEMDAAKLLTIAQREALVLQNYVKRNDLEGELSELGDEEEEEEYLLSVAAAEFCLENGS